MEKEKLFYLFKKSFKEFQNDNALTSAAALAFYSLISIAPLVVLIILVGDFFFDSSVLIGQFRTFAFNFGGGGAANLADFLSNAAQSRQKGSASIISLLAVILGGTALFAHLQDTINRMWGIEKRIRPRKKIAGRIIRKRLMSLFLVFVFVIIMIASVIAMAIIADINRSNVFFNFSASWNLFVLNVINYALTLGLVTLFFALLFRIFPDKNVSYKDVRFGAFVTAVLFLISQILIGVYFNYAEFSTGFGAAGSVIILLVWMYYSAIVFLFGAEFTYVYSTEYRSKKKRIKT